MHFEWYSMVDFPVAKIANNNYFTVMFFFLRTFAKL